jgi:hypothetical protein
MSIDEIDTGWRQLCQLVVAARAWRAQVGPVLEVEKQLLEAINGVDPIEIDGHPKGAEIAK